MRPERHEKRREIMDERARKDRLIKITDYNSQLDQLQRKYKLHSNGDISWQASIVFAVICKLIKALEENKCLTLMEICNIVGQRSIRKPCGRYVYNMYTSWRLTRTFTPLHRGRTTENIFEQFPNLKRKSLKWARRRMFKRKAGESALTAGEFRKFMNALFVRYE